MKPLFTITTEYGGYYYDLFYFLAIITCVGFMTIQGYRRKYPMSQWMLIILSGTLFFILGYKFFAYSLEEWKNAILDFQLPVSSKKTILGGLVGLIVGVGIAKQLLRFRFPVIDMIAVAVPLSMAIQRVGCLMTGCCFGKPSDLPWAISYSKHTLPYHVHLDRGLIQASDLSSLCVHPTQLYQVIFCLIIAVIVWKFRKYWKTSGSQFLFALLLYAGFRFCSEFFRDTAANFINDFFLGLKIVQWIILAAIVILTITIYFKEKSRKGFTTSTTFRGANLTRSFLLGVSLLTVFWLNFNRFEPIEKLVIYLILLLTVLDTGWNIYKKQTHPGYRWVSPTVILFGLLFTSQSYIPKNKNEKVTFDELGIGTMFSKYYEDVRRYNGMVYYSNCLGSGYRHSFSSNDLHEFSIGSLGIHYSYNEVTNKYKRFKLRIAGSLGQYHAKSIESNENRKRITIEFSPTFQWDWRGAGIGFGFNVGQLNYAQINSNPDNLDVGEWENSYKEYNFMPQFYLRFGPYDIAFIECNFANHFPSSSPMPLYTFGVGTGLGRVDGTKIATGITDAGYYFQAILPIKEKFLVDAYYTGNFKSGYELKNMFSIGFSYRFLNSAKIKVHESRKTKKEGNK